MRRPADGSGSVRALVGRLSWVQRALLVGLPLGALWSAWETFGIVERLYKDVLLYVLVPIALVTVNGRRIGFHLDGDVVRNTLLLSAFVLPFYVVGSSLPTVRSYYPMWGGTLGNFLLHTAAQFVTVLAAEVYFRGLLCVSVREIGWKAAFITPVLYAVQHVGKPPIEVLLSGPTDMLFGLVDYESASIVPSLVAHGFGYVLLDWLVLHDPLIPQSTVVDWLSWLPVRL